MTVNPPPSGREGPAAAGPLSFPAAAPAALLDDLQRVLGRAQRHGVLGPGPVFDHVEHAAAFVEAIAPLPSGTRAIDLGSGAGIPGLVVALARPDVHITLLDASGKRVDLLNDAIRELRLSDQADVVQARAEDAGRDPRLRGAAGVVMARLFGPPAVVAECAAPLLAVDGVLVVSEPPGRPDRWPEEGLVTLGLAMVDSPAPGVVVLRQVDPCPARFPRRNGVPAKRPLF